MATYKIRKQSDDILDHLKQLFGNTLNVSVIRRVAESCNFDAVESSYKLTQILQQSSPSRMNHSPEKKSRKRMDIENAIKKINGGYKVIVLLRGLPGSGKSTLGKYLLTNTIGFDSASAKNHLLSTDDYFMKNGVYDYNPMMINEAHGWNHQRAFGVMSKGYSPVIIDNTNVQMWEMKAYAVMATDFGYYLEILEPDTHWCFNDKELAKRNKHNVPKANIRNMIERYDKNVTPMKLLTAYDCKYKLQKPPQMRLYPPPAFNGTRRLNTVIKSKSVGEPINLMDFSELAQVESTTKRVVDENKPFNSVDNMLMHNDGVYATNILQPEQSKRMKGASNLFDNIKIWGIDEEALNSWDIVTPVKENSLDKVELLPVVTIDDDDDDFETRDASTNTDDEDFSVLKNGWWYKCRDGIKIRETCNRDIGRNIIPKALGIRKKLMLDKGCMTEDVSGDYQCHLQQLTNVFPNVPLRNIEHWYNKCNRDIECTLEFLLAEKDDILNQAIENEEFSVEKEEIDDKMAVITIDSDSDSSNECRSSHKLPRNKRKDLTAESMELKKSIESKVTISDDHYSDKILKIKQIRYGERNSKSAGRFASPQPSTSSTSDSTPPPDSPEQIDLSDEPFEFVDMEPMDQLDTVELNLGEFFVGQLEEKFGDPNLMYPRGFQNLVQVPVSLAQQLYAFYIESVYQQMDAQNTIMEQLVKEDEEFARKLQEDEEKAAQLEEGDLQQHQPSQMEIPEIMREERQRNKWQKEVDKWKDLNPDTLAAKMTREKLFKTFPSVDKEVLVELLYAHDNVYKDTVEILLNNMEEANVYGDLQSIKDPPLSEEVLDEMKKAYADCNDTEDDNEAYSGRDYREEAKQYLEKRSNLYQKAQRCYQKGMKDVAQFYSGLASQQTRYYEQANSRAATAFLDEHSKRLQKFNTLDLHFLYVKEALPSLDVFLDRNINLLRHSTTKSQEYLQVITGRGKNSHFKKSVLRPAVQNHLNKRGLSYNLLNRGMLEVKVSRNSKLTSEM